MGQQRRYNGVPIFLVGVVLLALAACTAYMPAAWRGPRLLAPALEAGFQPLPLSATPLPMTALLHPGHQDSDRAGGTAPASAPLSPFPSPPEDGGAASLRVVIEGDGHAFLASGPPSPDPTPREATGLAIALEAVGTAPVLYLGRPCQYEGAGTAPCHSHFWTRGRFAPEVVASLGQAIDRGKAATGARTVSLIGYSGGGVLAAILAGQRADTHSLLTIAAPLDHQRWTRTRRRPSLSGSLSPFDPAWQGRLACLPQHHVIGTEDDRVPPSLVLETAERLRDLAAEACPGRGAISVERVAGIGHAGPWRPWPGRQGLGLGH